MVAKHDLKDFDSDCRASTIVHYPVRAVIKIVSGGLTMPQVVPRHVVTLIDQVLPGVKDQEKDKPVVTLEPAHAALVAGIVAMTDQVPAELLPADPNRYMELLAALSALRSALRMWEGQGSTYTLRNLPGFGYSPLYLIRRALVDLPDAVASPEVADLQFLADSKLIATLRVDISNATSALRNGEWKAATVLAGSVIEALLLWSITRHSQSDWEEAMRRAAKARLGVSGRNDHPEEWHLPDYIEVAGELGCIADGTRLEARRAREYRNLIHPGKTQRTGQQCDLGTAHIAVGTMDHVIRDSAAKGETHSCP